jgi:hypothetical protein
VVAIAVLVSAFLKSMFELLTVGTFPFFVLMFFSIEKIFWAASALLAKIFNRYFVEAGPLWISMKSY